MNRFGVAMAVVAALLSVGAAAPATAETRLGEARSIAADQLRVTTAAVLGNTLNPGSMLNVGDELRSTSAEYKFVLQTDGNAVVYGPQGALWGTGNRGTRLVMQHDGNLVLYPASGPATWSSRTDGSPGARAVLADDGSLSVLSSGGTTLLRTPADPAKVAGDRLLAGQVLGAGQTLTGAGGAILVMQRDGNLVRYESGRATWATGTSGASPQLALQRDGNLVLYTSDRGAVWSTRTDGRGGSLLVVQRDGNVVLYAGSTAVWATGVSPPALAGRDARVVELTNAERTKVGCQPLRVDARLSRAAELHSQDMRDRNYFDHVSPSGSTPNSRVAAQGYPGQAGENIAAGYPTPEDVMQAWMNSAGHRANILNCSYTAIGVGTATGGFYGIYWTQNFGLV